MADKREVNLLLKIKTEGSDLASQDVQAIASGATQLQKELGKLSRGDQISRIGAEMGLLAKRTKDVGAAVDQLNKELKELGASEDEIRAAASAFSAAESGGPSNRLQRLGSELRSLPSQQTPFGFSTDQVAGFIRLGGAISGVSEKAVQASKVAQTLTPVLGETAAGLVSLGLSAAPFILAVGAIALAVKNFADEQQKQADAINAQVDALRSVGQDIAGGLTTEEAKKQLDELADSRQAEIDLLNKQKQVYRETVDNQDVASRDITRLLSGAEQALADQIAESEANVASYDTKINALNASLDDGALAANDAAEAEKKLAEERSKTALASADSAAKQLQAEQKALNSTEEQNLKRLDTIEDEKAVIEKQIEVLEQSGVTSEDVTSKIASLKESLGLLGKETEFINATALEASRAADAEKKAKKDAEDAAKKAQQAQEQYTKAVQSAQTTLRQSVQDIGIRFTQTLQDNETKFNRDLTDIATKYRRDEYDLTVKANRAERDALQEQLNDLEDVRKDAYKDEQKALEEGDFKALFLARQKGEEALNQQQEEIDQSRDKREQADRDAREDLLRNAQRTRIDRMMNYDRQLIDARTAQGRELAQAQLTRQRALQAAQEGMRAELGLIGNYWNQRLQIEQQGLTRLLNMQGAGPRGGADALRTGAAQAQVFGGLSQVIRR